MHGDGEAHDFEGLSTWNQVNSGVSYCKDIASRQSMPMSAASQKAWSGPLFSSSILDDREGRKLAGALMAKERQTNDAEGLLHIDAKAAEIRTKGDVIPALVMVIELEGAAIICQRLTDNGGRMIRQIPDDRIPVVVVSGGGNSYAGIPRRV